MIYDFSGGFNNASVMVADSGRVKFTEDKKYLLLSLYDGETFENLKNQRMKSGVSNIPYRREVFGYKEILLDFDSDFTRFDESILEDQHVSKNIKQLTHSIDSVNKIVDLRIEEQATDIVANNFFAKKSIQEQTNKPSKKINLKKFDSDTLLMSYDQGDLQVVATTALQQAKEMQSIIEYNNITLGEPQKYVSRHEIEWHRKFTLSFACLIFFFIGAPLGAIIRKGGLGAPVVISVIMFIIYYIIDNTGYKMSREGLWTAFEGMWLSSSVLLPLGIFLTYKSANDATLFNPEQYVKMWDRFKQKISSIVNKKSGSTVNKI